MPRNVRNFWVEADIDGRRERLSGGPVARDGGFELTVYIRDRGSVRRAVEMRGYEYEDGKLRLWVREADPTRTGVFPTEGLPEFTIESQR